MESDELSNDGNPSQQETAISLEGKKIEVSSPEPQSKSPELSTDSKIEKKNVPDAKVVRNKPNGSHSLVMQMFSHLKTQRQFKEEKNSKIARSDRRRQKIKRELAASCPPVGSSLKNFESSWTQCRMLRGPQSKLQETHADIPRGDSPTGFNQKEYDHTSSTETQVFNSELSAVRVHSIDQTGKDQANGRNSGTIGSFEHFHQVQHKQQTEKTSSYRFSRFQDHNRRHADSRTSQNSQQFGTRVFSDQSNSKSHVLKGPGKIQIRFSTNSIPSSRQTGRGQMHNYQWDTMPAGTLTSVRASLITLDGSLL